MKTTIKNRILRLVLIALLEMGIIVSIAANLMQYFISVKQYKELSAFAATSYSRDILDGKDKLASALAAVAANLSDKSSISVTNTDFSAIYFVDSSAKTADGVSFADVDSVKSALTGEESVSAPQPSPLGGNAVITAVPYNDGCLVGISDENYFGNILDGSTFGSTGKIFVVDSANNLVASSDKKSTISEGRAEFVSQAVAEELTEKTYTADGTKHTAQAAKIENTDNWYIITEYENSEIMSAYSGTFWISLAIVLVLMICNALFDIKIAESISAPIVKVSDRLEAFSNGDLSSPMPHIKSKDETLILSSSLSSSIYSIKAYIDDIGHVLSEIASGNLEVQTEQSYFGDFAQIKESLDGITTGLRNVFNEIDCATNQVHTGAEQVSNGASQLSESAATEAATMEQLNSMVSEIYTHVKANSDNAVNASKLAVDTNAKVKAGSVAMGEMLAAIEEIQNSSDRISKIIKVIDDIAFQTNILALNAAVEAARAGAAGKGFAVVADEVRNLAAKSAEAAKETSGLIEGSIEKVQHGTALADQTASLLDEIVRMVARVEGYMSEIAQASSEQTDSIKQINVGMEQITGIIQTNSATAQQSAAASEELSGQSETLKIQISKFSNNSGNQRDETPTDETPFNFSGSLEY